MNLKIVSLTLCFLLGIAIGVVNKAYKAVEAKDKQIDDLKSQLQQASDVAYHDCQVWMINDRRIQQVSGCYKGMEQLCMRTSKPYLCSEKFSQVCREIED